MLSKFISGSHRFMGTWSPLILGMMATVILATGGPVNAVLVCLSSAVLFRSAFPLLAEMEESENSDVTRELTRIQENRQQIAARIEEKEKRQDREDPTDKAELLMTDILKYVAINRGQAEGSFKSSRLVFFGGFAVILLGIGLVYSDPTGRLQVGVLATISGLLLQFITFAQLHIFNKSLEQIDFFVDKLVSLHDTRLSIKLCDQLDDKMKGEVKRDIVLALMNRTSRALGATPSPKHIRVRRNLNSSVQQRGNQKMDSEDVPHEDLAHPDGLG